HNGEKGASFFVGLFENEVAFNNIAAGAAGKKLIIEHADQEQAGNARQAQPDVLHTQKDLPANSCGNFDDDVSKNSHNNPAIISQSQGSGHLGALIGIVK